MVEMESIAFAVPILPGKSDDARLIFSESMGKRREEFGKSCNALGLTREFAWIQKSPTGDTLILYLESDDMASATKRWMEARSGYDKWLKEQLHYVTGIDYTDAKAVPPAPDFLYDLQADAVAHAVPVVMALPILAGKTEAVKSWMEELKGPRCDELRNYLERAGLSRESWYLQTSPGGDLLITFALVEDPEQSFRGYAYSEHPFDLWMKAKILEFTGIDLNAPKEGPLPERPMPELVLDWHHAFEAAA
jgi:hypothetical protein